MKQRYIILVLLYLCCSSAVAAQDTTRRAVTLPVITVIQTNSRPESFKAQTPTQVTPSEKMEQLGDAQLSDVLRRMVGVSLKDYGGIGGIKTVSARGLGSQFSTLTIDGVAVTDCQNGQVDLGRYMLGNSSYISLANGQMDNTLNSAKAYAAGSIINMETHEPEFGARPFNLRLGADPTAYCRLRSPTSNGLGSACPSRSGATISNPKATTPSPFITHQDAPTAARASGGQTPKSISAPPT